MRLLLPAGVTCGELEQRGGEWRIVAIRLRAARPVEAVDAPRERKLIARRNARRQLPHVVDAVTDGLVQDGLLVARQVHLLSHNLAALAGDSILQGSDLDADSRHRNRVLHLLLVPRCHAYVGFGDLAELHLPLLLIFLERVRDGLVPLPLDLIEAPGARTLR